MLIRANDIIGSKIYTISEGKEIDEVKDIIYSPESNRVVGLLVDTAGLLSDAKIIFLENAKSIGKDAVLIDSESVIKNSGDIPENIASIAENNNFLSKTKVITENGINLGKISDMFFDPATGEVSEFEVSQGLSSLGSGKKTFHVEDILTVGRDATIVRGYTEEKFAEQGEERGMKGAVNNARDSIQTEVPAIAEEVRKRIEELVEKSRQKLNEFEETPEVQQGISKARGKAERAASRLKEKGRELKAKEPETENVLYEAKEDVKKGIGKAKKKSEVALGEAKKATQRMPKERLRKVGRGGGLQIYAQSVRIEGGRAKTIRRSRSSKKR